MTSGIVKHRSHLCMFEITDLYICCLHPSVMEQKESVDELHGTKGPKVIKGCPNLLITEQGI